MEEDYKMKEGENVISWQWSRSWAQARDYMNRKKMGDIDIYHSKMQARRLDKGGLMGGKKGCV